VAGFSINVLTMFGMVLAIGILVDDAIVVVENVERLMAQEGLSPYEATKKAMSQISGAIIGITVVLVSVFIPMAFFAGSVGNIYRQFSLSMVASMLFSAFLALSLTPALCATLLKPVPDDHHEKGGFFGWFNRGFTATTHGYESTAAKLVKRGGRVLLVYVLIVAVVGWLYVRMPTAFLPNEDQGNLIVNVQLPPGATSARTEAVISQVEDYFKKQPEVESVIGVVGFSFSGSGQNAALGFVTLKDFSQRKGDAHSAQALAGRAFGALMGIRDAFIYPLNPPPIRELGNATGFALRLQDRGGVGHEALLAARNQLMGMAMQSKIITGLRPDGLEDAPQLQLDIDRDKAYALGVSFDAISTTLSTALGSAYINDFPNQSRLQRVVVQADAQARMQPEQIMQLNITNSAGQSVPLSAFVSTRWVTGQMQAVRYNGYPAMRLAGDAAAGSSTGQAIAEMAMLASKLPAGIGIEWTGLSREEQSAGSQATTLLVFSLLAVFLCLAALYESWSIPVAVLLVVPLGILGSLLGATMRDLPNDVFFKVGLITIIGLSAKNAILIIEFARELQNKGMGVLEATLQACHLRFRPIIMTSVAFILGVLPLVISTGAGSASQRAIGTGVMSGMIAATLLAVFFVPVFFVVVRRFFPVRPAAASTVTTSDQAETAHE
jgi:multidrug efflux pump